MPFAWCAPRPSAAPRRCRPKTRSSSRCRMPARPNGTARIRPGSSNSFCSSPIATAIRCSTSNTPILFNSYYVAAGPRHARPQRGMLTRPDAADIAAYRAHVDAAVERLILESSAETFEIVAPLVELGLNHEQQHQELLLTDILHAFAQNPISPAYNANWRPPRTARREGYAEIAEGMRNIGHAEAQFSFRQRRPRASRTGRPGAHRARAGHQRRMARVHARRRLYAAGTLAVRRLGDRRQPKNGPRRDTGARSTAPGMR